MLDQNISTLRAWCIRYHRISMNIKGCINTTRNVLAIGISIISILGFTTFSVGLACHISSKVIQMLGIPGIASFPTWLMVIGLSIFTISIIAVIGITTLNNKLLALFSALLITIFVSQIGVGIAAYIEREHLPELVNYAWIVSDVSTRLYFEKFFECCGYYNTSDHVEINSVTGVCYCYNSSSTMCWKIGCKNKIFTTVQRIFLKVCICAVTVTILELIVLISTIALMYKIGHVKDQYFKLVQEENGDERKIPINFTTDDEFKVP